MSKRDEPRPIGSVFHTKKYGLLQVVENLSCEGCIFNTAPSKCEADSTSGKCSAFDRKDCKSVIFKQYKK